DAILVGRNTVEKDNPSLTTRLPQGGKNPTRIILDTHLSLTQDFQLFNHEAPTWIVCGKDADKQSFLEKYPHIKIIQMPESHIILTDVMEVLAEEKIQSLYIEGGSTIHQAFLKEKLVDECHWYIAPKLLGGKNAVSVIGGESPEWMREAQELTFKKIEQIARDLKIIAIPKEEA